MVSSSVAWPIGPLVHPTQNCVARQQDFSLPQFYFILFLWLPNLQLTLSVVCSKWLFSTHFHFLNIKSTPRWLCEINFADKLIHSATQLITSNWKEIAVAMQVSRNLEFSCSSLFHKLKPKGSTPIFVKMTLGGIKEIRRPTQHLHSTDTQINRSIPCTALGSENI